MHQENSWLENVHQRINSSKVGADAEELSEELDVKYFFKNYFLNAIVFLYLFKSQLNVF